MYCFTKCCCLCLIKNNTLANIKCSGSDGISYLNKLGQLAPSLVANPRDYMLWICEQCRKRLKKAYRFIQNCFKSDAVLEQYCMQLTNADTAQNNCIDSHVSAIQLIENIINVSIPISVKEECLEDLHAFDDQYYLESTITIDEHNLSPIDFEIKFELKKEASYVDDDSTLNNEIMVSECDRDQTGNVQQIDPIAGISGENYIISGSDVPNDVDDHADNSNINSSNLLTKNQSIKSRKVSNKRCFKCDICDKTFTKFGNLNEHKRIHSGERPYKCKICKKTFAQYYLKTHERIHSGERPYKCKICKKAFNESGTLKTHERFHTGERPYKCKICKKAFTLSGDLKKHERIHSGERPYKCKICKKAFAQSGDLKSHERVHSGERPYKCKICKKTFNKSGDLKRHEMIHNDERPYKCKMCAKTFNRSEHLKNHERVHTGVRPFRCKICSKTFSYSHDLKRHERVHTGNVLINAKHLTSNLFVQKI